MNRFLMSLTVAALMINGTAQAADKGKPSNNKNDKNNSIKINQNNVPNHQPNHVQILEPKGNFKDFHLKNGIKFDFGFKYVGFAQPHWTKKFFFDAYGCNCYWCPYSSAWYYWCPLDNCWYPVNYCPYQTYVF